MDLDNQQKRLRKLGMLGASFASALLLIGCGRDRQDGGKPPSTLGTIDAPFFGCPKLAGDYMWPPVAGEYADGQEAPGTGTWPVAIWKGRHLITVEEKNKRITIKAYTLYEDEAGQELVAKQPAYTEYDGSQFSCRHGMLVITPTRETPQTDYGGTGLKRGYRLARTEDGGLIVGVEAVATGRKTSLVQWGDQTAGDVDLPDKSHFTWSKLKSKDQ